uniref:C2H2-type domain-containing protein n=1 Tax=Meloidogyne hapla TaxID=6305 RepID=A0A1I8C156_MELHA
MGRALSICYCNLCKHQFQIKDEEGIDLHLKTEEHILNAMDAIKSKIIYLYIQIN